MLWHLASKAKNLTDLSRVFLEPATATQRQHEALRAFFVGDLSGAEVASRFGYSPSGGLDHRLGHCTDVLTNDGPIP